MCVCRKLNKPTILYVYPNALLVFLQITDALVSQGMNFAMYSSMQDAEIQHSDLMLRLLRGGADPNSRFVELY